MDRSPVDAQYSDIKQMLEILGGVRETSLQNSASDSFRKVLVLAAASYFETQICAVIIDFVTEKAGADTYVVELVRKKAITRQYHTLFQWEAGNANSFFAHFGRDFSAQTKAQVKADEQLETSIRAFVEIGHLRNQLVHENFAVFPMEKTLDEIYDLYKTARRFVDWLPVHLRVGPER